MHILSSSCEMRGVSPQPSILPLSLRFFEKDALAQRGVELHKLDFAFDLLPILAGPDNVVRLRGLEPE